MLLPTFIKGHVTISDAITGEILIDKDNQIHYENMSVALAQSLTGDTQNNILYMYFGNGGTSVDPTGVITYLPPNTNTQNSDLYNPTFNKIVNQSSELNSDPINNRIDIRHITGEVYTDLLISCRLDYGEPGGQAVIDLSENTDEDFVFDELGIKSRDQKLLTHVIFHPIQKSLNRLIQVDYTIRIQTLSSLSGV
jgi:hypothetical protein